MDIKLDKTKPYGIIRGQQTGAAKLAFYQNGHYFDPKGEHVELNPTPVKEPEVPVIPVKEPEPEVPVIPVKEPEPEVPVVVEEPAVAVKLPKKPKVQLPPGLPTKE